jgi:succinate dehydrogenase hydrophobic anchor subunit
LLLALLAVLVAHIKEGVENIIQDYVHNEKTKLVSFYLLACTQAASFKYMYIFLVLGMGDALPA